MKNRIQPQLKVGDRLGTMSALGNLSNIYHHRGDSGYAVEMYCQAPTLAREIGDRQKRGTRSTTWS